MKKLKVVSLLLAGALLFSALPVNAESLSEAKKKKAEIQSSLDEANALVDSLNESMQTKEEKIEALSKEISSLEKESQSAESELDSLNKDIDYINECVNKAKEVLQSKQSDMSIRIIYSYENGRYNLLNAIFTSKNIIDFLNAIQYSMDIAKYDKEVMEEYEQALQVLSEQTNALASKQEDAERIVSENDNRLEAITALKTAQENELTGVEGELKDAQAIARVYELEMQTQNEVLSAIVRAIEAEKEEARQQAIQQQQQQQQATQTQEKPQQPEHTEKVEENKPSENSTPTPTPAPTPAPTPTPSIPSSNNVSGFTWPCPASHRITSDFGNRESPTAGASTNHKGIDIGAPTGSAIVAAQAGKVILSQYSNSAGNYIIVSHGINKSGKLVCTVYMHASERLVSVGQQVTKGQTIAKVGSTGYSTGPHLHFGVSEDGTYVSPWNYL